jgi:mono/diheme cytochrome c family protein
MKRWSIAAMVASASLACSSERLAPAPQRSSSARAFGIFSTEIAPDAREQAMRALESDARRRELRFLDAATPGYAFATTRVPQAEIDGGQWPPGDVYQLGAQLFHHRFRREEGFGGADLPRYSRFQRGLRGGPDAYQCADCHRRGGLAGSGDGSDNAYIGGNGERQTTGFERNPIALTGAGFVEILASEISAELARKRDALVAAAKANGGTVREPLTAKGVSFGFLGASADGSIDTRDVKGVEPDLVIRPFGWKGHTATIREMVEYELATHHGMQSDHLVANASPSLLGPFGGGDPDGDGVAAEISEGQVTALTLFIAMQEVPTIEPPVGLPGLDLMPMWGEGLTRFTEIGCATCHVPSLPLESTTFVLPHRGGGPEYRVDLAKHGAMPRIARPGPGGGFRLWLFSDLKRHDMGLNLADGLRDRDIAESHFLTPPLWGIARSRPYLHNAQAPTLEDAILRHGGEAQAARDKYAAFDDRGRAPIRVYLTSLTRARRFLTP